MGLIDTQRWWRKHGITAEAQIVEVGLPKQSNVRGFFDQDVTVDIRDESTGQDVRMTSSVLTNTVNQAGGRLKVRWSPKRDYFQPWSAQTAPEDEALAALNASPPAPAAPGLEVAAGLPSGSLQVVDASGAGPAAALAKVSALHDRGVITDAQWAAARSQLGGAAPEAPAAIPAARGGENVEERLAKLDELKAAGVLDDAEYAQQRRRVLDSI
jgi:hypothetical protein